VEERIAVYRWARKIPESRLQRRCEESARHNRSTALVVRPGEADIRFYERGAAKRLERQGIGAIHGGKFVMMVDVTPRWAQLADSGARPTARRGFLLLMRRVVDAKLILGVQHLVPRPLVLLAQLQKVVLVGEGVPD
jgi:hypothetical protein